MCLINYVKTPEDVNFNLHIKVQVNVCTDVGYMKCNTNI